jgi:hypothetical protein
VPRKCDSQLSNRLAARERDRQKCDYSSHAYAIAAAPNHASGFGRVPPQVHMRVKSQREQHQFSFAPFAGIVIDKPARDIAVPVGTPVTPLISR